ncbi:hypothetical protein PoB_007143700 [Plakobranchus ocellatus]|uniref:Uncharacterized protein n=1 Tax=Plakobranchus ocellatus TaxID=259542 RepID=A0AAV4DLM7_9GAST|nr:hypothetical protein PoB_007143700 [Plakobranchus ocellatus]
MYPVHNKVILGFQALRQARAPVAGLEPATEGSLQISGRTRKPLCYRRHHNALYIALNKIIQAIARTLSGPLSGQGAGGGARTRDRKVPADLYFTIDSIPTVPSTPHTRKETDRQIGIQTEISTRRWIVRSLRIPNEALK